MKESDESGDKHGWGPSAAASQALRDSINAVIKFFHLDLKATMCEIPKGTEIQLKEFVKLSKADERRIAKLDKKYDAGEEELRKRAEVTDGRDDRTRYL